MHRRKSLAKRRKDKQTPYTRTSRTIRISSASAHVCAYVVLCLFSRDQRVTVLVFVRAEYIIPTISCKRRQYFYTVACPARVISSSSFDDQRFLTSGHKPGRTGDVVHSQRIRRASILFLYYVKIFVFVCRTTHTLTYINTKWKYLKWMRIKIVRKVNVRPTVEIKSRNVRETKLSARIFVGLFISVYIICIFLERVIPKREEGS